VISTKPFLPMLTGSFCYFSYHLNSVTLCLGAGQNIDKVGMKLSPARGSDYFNSFILYQTEAK
jgi:hypothetical protein